MPLDVNTINVALADAIIDITKAKTGVVTEETYRLVSRAMNLLALVQAAVGGDVKATSGGVTVADQTAKNVTARAGEPP
jgi:hypothetical protein